MSILAKQDTSFEETYKSSYSHGLEEIYAIETVDLKSVRKISEPQSEVAPELIEYTPQRLEDQLELDLGAEFRKWIEPFFLKEPIQVLGLSQGAEKCLVDNQKMHLKDLIHTDLKQFVLGQGHIDEIQKKLNGYIGGRSAEKSYSPELSSWVRSFFSQSCRQKVSASLAEYGLDELLPLTKIEKTELRQASRDTRLVWLEDVKQECHSRKKELDADLKNIAEVFLLPWVRARLGLVRKRELKERILRVSGDQRNGENIFSFLSEVCFGGEIPFRNHLLQLEPNLFCSDPHVGTAYVQITERAISYFYQPNLVYQLPELITWLQKEFVTEWNGYDEELIEKVLRLSCHFRVRKGSRGVLEVRLV